MANNGKNIVFLDIDGVLNHGNLSQCNSLVDSNVPLCKDNLLAFKRIIDNVDDIGIVWSSDWRFAKEQYNSWKNPKDWIEKNFLEEGIVIGNNPRKMSSNRFEEIHFWFTSNEYSKKFYGKEWVKDPYYEVRNYVVIDDFDSPGMKMYGNHFFKCNPDIGLTIEYASQIIEYLKRRDFDIKDLDWSKND